MAEVRITDYCLVGEQPLPNLLPVLDPAFRPNSVVLIATSTVNAQAQNIRRVLSPIVSVEVLIIPSAYDIRGIVQTVRAHAQSRRDRGEATRLNLTGGTKIMAIAAYTAFDAGRDGRIYYLKHNTNQLEWIDEHHAHPQVQLEADIDLTAYFLAHGYSLVYDHGAPAGPAHEAYAMQAGLQCNKLSTGLRSINAAITGAYQDGVASGDAIPIIESWHRKEIQPLMQIAQHHGLVEWRAGTIHLLGEPKFRNVTRRILTGGWLECYVHGLVRGYRGHGVQDVGLNPRIQSSDAPPDEIDVAYLVRNRLTLVECKTEKNKNPAARSYATASGGGGAGNKTANDATFRLASIKQTLGALGVELVLVTLHPLTAAQLKRAENNKIKVVNGPAQIAGFGAEFGRRIRPSLE
jgi:hypothetical protein